MDNNNRETEKSLKRFLKKKIAYTAGLLVAFLISGSVGFASSEELASQVAATHEYLISNIEAQKAEVQALLDENEARLRQLKLDTDELIRKGEWYSKPVYKQGFPGQPFPAAQQVWFSYWFEDAGKSKDNTKHEWKNTIDAIAYKKNFLINPKGKNPYSDAELSQGLTESLQTVPDDLLDKNINGNIPAGSLVPNNGALATLHQGNGVFIDEPPYVESLEVGANIKPLNPTLPVVNKSLNISVSTPSVVGPTINAIPSVTPPAAPADVNVTVTPPAAVAAITVTPPTAPSPQVPGPMTIAVPTVATPSAVDPTMIAPPENPSTPDINVPSIPEIDFVSGSLGNSNKIYVITEHGLNGAIANVGVMGGTFNVKRSYSTFDYNFTNYKANTYLGAPHTQSYPGETVGQTQSANTTVTYASGSGSYANVAYVGQATGIQVVAVTYPGIYTNATFNVARELKSETDNLGEFVHMDNHGATNSFATLRGHLAALTSSDIDIMAAWDSAAAASNSGLNNNGKGYYWVNSGKIIIEGGNQSITNQYIHGSNSVSLSINTGDIIIRPYIKGGVTYDAYNSGFLISQAVNYDSSQHVLFNAGTITASTNDTAAYTINTTVNNKFGAVVVNRGTIEMSGNHSIGVYARATGSTDGRTDLDFTKYDGSRAPITLYGDNSIGLYVGTPITTYNHTVKGNFNVNIGDSTGKANIASSTGNENGGTVVTDYTGDNTVLNTIDKTVGILAYKDITLTSHGIEIFDKTDGVIGVIPANGASLTLGDGSLLPALSNKGIILNKGKNNIGIYVDDGTDPHGNPTDADGTVTTTGSVNLVDGTNNMAIYASGNDATVDSVNTSGSVINSVVLYAADGAIVTATNGGTLNGLQVTGATTSNNYNAMAAYAESGATIKLNNATIDVTGMELPGGQSKFRGIGLMANGGTISSTGSTITVTNGAAGVASIGALGNINLTGSSIEVDNGYAAYSDGTGAIDLTNANIVLKGDSTAFDVYLSGGGAMTFSGTNIMVQSNDVIVYNVKNLIPIDVSDLSTDINPTGVTVSNDGVHTSYIEAAVDGATINFDQAIDKAAPPAAPPIPPAPPTPGYVSYYYYNRFIAQNSILNVNSPVKAELTSAQAANFKNQVIALEANSSKNATSNATTQINNNSTITAARTDAGNGAVGTFINYGQMNNAGSITIQNGYTSVQGGVGIYATNGSAVDNQAAGTIDVYGEKALGIYATAWRETTTPGTYAVKEFGTGAVDQGLTSVVNNGNITTHDNSSVGIFMDNNSIAAGTPVAISGTNAGTITIGEDSIGLYAKGNGVVTDTTIGNTGTLVIGKNSAGMYGENSLTIDNIGNLTLGEGAIGVVLDPNSVVAMTGTVGTITTSTATGDKAVVAINGAATGAPVTTTIGLPSAAMNLQGTDSVTALYAQGVTGATNNSTDLKLGNKGVGVYVNNGIASNAAAGVINIDAGQANAVGMYTAYGTVINDGTINVNDSTGLGMVASTTSGIVNNNLNIALGATGATGMYANLGATVNDAATGNITFAATPNLKAFGIVADGATVNLYGGTKTIDNSGANIYTYAMNGSTVNINGALTIDGVADADPVKSVGIYLDGTNSLNNASIMTAMNAAVGVYVNGANTLTGGTYVSDGDKTVGIYMSNGGTLDGLTINAQSPVGTSAIGAYVAGGTATIATGLNLNIGASGAAGTGMYFANGANAAGAPITITNSSTDANVGLYYTGGVATHSTDINMTGANMIVGLYGDAAGTNVTNGNTITDTTAKSVGAMASNGATVTNAGTINTDTSPAAQSVGMYTETGNLLNTGVINVTDGLGVALATTGGTYNGAGGNITVSGAGAALSLDATVAGQVVDAGTMNITGVGVGVYAKNAAIVDFPMIMTGSSGTGVYAKAGTTVTGTIDGSASSNTIGLFTEDATVNMPSATVKAGINGIGWYQGGAGQSYATTGNTIESSQPSSIGVYVDAGNSYASGDTINAGTGGIGVLTYGTFDTNGTTMNIDGSGIGVVAQAGSMANIGTTGPINVTFTGAGGILSFANGGTVTLGSLITTTGAGTLSATLNGNLTNAGTISIENGAYGLVGAYDAGAAGFMPVYNIKNASTGDITVKSTPLTSSIGMAVVKQTGGTAPASGAVLLENDGHIAVQDANSVGMYATVGTINNNSTVDVTDKGIGMYATENATIGNIGTVNVTSGVGYVADGVNITPSGTLNLNNGTSADYSIGGYYKDVNASITLPTVTAADYSITAAIDGGINSLATSVNGGSASGTNQIGVFVNGSTTQTTFHGITTTGDENIGVYVSKATIDGTGTITAAPSTASADKSKSSVGIYLNEGTLNAGSDTANVGDNSIGIYGKQANMTIGTVNTGDAAVGIYGSDGGQVAVTNGMTVGKGTLGAFGKDTDVTVTGSMTVDTDLGVGIVSEGTGNVDYTGAATVADKVNSASIAIYKKDGQGTITANAGSSFNVGKGGYAVYADASGATGPVTVNNNASIALNESSVGIYGSGSQTTVVNNSDITVGDTYMFNADHSVSANDLNSVALYGENYANVINNGTLTVDKDHSVGAYVITNSTFTNASTGVINVDNGGVGVLALGATVNNEGVINTLYGLPTCEKGKSIGIAAYTDVSGTKGVVNNSGTINVGEGVGVYLGPNTELNNAAGAKILIDKGIGVFGDGLIYNNGTIEVIPGGSGSTTAQLNQTPVQQGAITVADTGEVIVNNQYVHLGGQFIADNIVLNGPTVDITGSLNGAQSEPYFTANTIEGIITLRPNFITSGNGYSWSVEDFVTVAQNIPGDLDIAVSPLFIAHMVTKGTSINSLSVVKQPYAYMVTGSQFDNLYNGVDSLLAKDQSGTSSDSVVLKQLNAYLDQVYTDDGQQAFSSEADRTLAEMRGDIYSTTYKRMENIQTSFDNSFYELLNARNATKDSGKFSVIYQQGKYDDDTLGVDDYDYRVTGLMYMRENESRNYGNKAGYSLGFTVSRFDFDDAPTFGDKSKEDVYSLRAGLHNVHSFGEDGANDRLRLISRLELGYNRHEAVRTMELDKLYKNKGNYNSMNVSLDNKLEATIYRDLKTDVVVYGAINMEYGYMGKFTEKAKGDSALELTVKDQDYYSIEPEVGVDASRRAYLGKRLSLKLFGDLAYGYELGNYGEEHRKARVNGGTEDYYELIKPAEEKGRIKGTLGLTLEKPNGFGITGDVQLRKHENKSSEDFRYGLRLNYTF